MQALDQALPRKPRLELTREQVDHLSRASEIILAVIATVGLATLAAVAPNALQLLNKLVFSRSKKDYTTSEKKRKIAETFYYLKRSGLVQIQQEKVGWKFIVTAKGRSRLEDIKFQKLKIPTPDSWDNSWWLVAADIPTKTNRLGADKLRNKLKNMGFYPLQRTLWLYPYNPCFELEFIAKTFHVEHFVTVMQVRKLDKEDESAVKKHFNKLGII